MSDDFGDAFSIRTLQDNVALAHDLPASDHARYRSENSSLFPYCNLWNQNLSPAGLRSSNWDVANPEGSDHDLGTHFATRQRDECRERTERTMLNLPGSVRGCIVNVGLDVQANGKSTGLLRIP